MVRDRFARSGYQTGHEAYIVSATMCSFSTGPRVATAGATCAVIRCSSPTESTIAAKKSTAKKTKGIPTARPALHSSPQISPWEDIFFQFSPSQKQVTQESSLATIQSASCSEDGTKLTERNRARATQSSTTMRTGRRRSRSCNSEVGWVEPHDARTPRARNARGPRVCFSFLAVFVRQFPERMCPMALASHVFPSMPSTSHCKAPGFLVLFGQSPDHLHVVR